MFVLVCNFECFFISFLDFFNLFFHRYSQNLVLKHVFFVILPVNWQVGIGSHFEVWIPKTFCSQSHLVSNKENVYEVLIMRPVLVLFCQIIINFSYPTSFELFLIYGNANWHVDRAFVEINVSARANTNKLALFSKCYWITP